MLTIHQALDHALKLHQTGHQEAAESLYRQILQAQPRHADALHLLGVVSHQTHRFDVAVALIKQSLDINPLNAAARSNLGEVYIATNRVSEAIDCHRRAIDLDPRFAAAHYNLGNALQMTDHFDEAIASYCRAIELKPDYASAYANLAAALAEQARLDESLKNYRIARHLAPWNSGIQSGLLYTLLFHPAINLAILSEEQKWWNSQFEQTAGRPPLLSECPCDPQRRLRIGYISPNFKDHVIGRNLIPLFRHHDRQQFEIVCYSDVLEPDAMTQEFLHCSDLWRDVRDLPTEMLGDVIRQDRVDILVDLSQHLAGNRLPVFATRNSPLQVSFAGYPESTGIESIEHRISDRFLENARDKTNPDSYKAETQRDHSKEHVHCIDSFWCYDPGKTVIAISPLPAKSFGDAVTFGSLNAFIKVNELIVKLWARILRQVDNSRLLLLCGTGSCRKMIAELFERAGVEANRVEFVPPRPRKDYLELYHRLDIVLDTFPYNGHTTSLDALWMGVPVVSLCGDRPVSRAGLSQLSNLGLPELVAFTEDQYVEIATRLAHDIPRIKELRATLRARMETSVLMDGPHFARQIEACYRSMWRQWCESQTA